MSWVSVGHNHGNDFYGLYQGVYLAYGRKSGFGGTSSRGLLHGARVFEVDMESGVIDTWVRQEDGTVHRETELRQRPKEVEPFIIGNNVVRVR